MPKIIRKLAFETNSSSSHSIAIDDSVKTYSSIDLNEDGYLVLLGGEFGWEWEKITDPLTKANYCAIDCAYDGSKIKMLKTVLKEQTGAKDIIFAFSKDWESPRHSYIDHESVGTSREMFSSEETLKNFIFGGGILYTGNDNDSAPPNFYDLNKTYTHTLSLEGSDSVVNLTEQETEEKEYLSKQIEDLFSQNKYSRYVDFSRYEERFSIPYNVEVVDFENKTLRIERTEEVCEKGEYKGSRVAEVKYLKWQIKEMDWMKI